MKEDDGTYLTPQNKIAPSHPAPSSQDFENLKGDDAVTERTNEDVQSDRNIIKLKCAVVVLMAVVLFALMALAIHLASSHPHRNILFRSYLYVYVKRFL